MAVRSEEDSDLLRMADTSTTPENARRFMERAFELKRRKHYPGNAVQRFGDWKKGEPTVMIDNQRWVALGKPESVKVVLPND